MPSSPSSEDPLYFSADYGETPGCVIARFQEEEKPVVKIGFEEGKAFV